MSQRYYDYSHIHGVYNIKAPHAIDSHKAKVSISCQYLKMHLWLIV